MAPRRLFRTSPRLERLATCRGLSRNAYFPACSIARRIASLEKRANPLRNSFVENMVVKRMQQLFAMGSAGKEILDAVRNGILPELRFGGPPTTDPGRGCISVVVFDHVAPCRNQTQSTRFVAFRISSINEGNGS